MAAAAASAAAAAEENSRNQIPKSIVFRSGKLSSGGSLDELKLNIRKMMEPHTAIKLRASPLSLVMITPHHPFCFYSLSHSLTLAHTHSFSMVGTSRSQTTRLYSHGRPTWCESFCDSQSIVAFYEPPNNTYSKRPIVYFSRCWLYIDA